MSAFGKRQKAGGCRVAFERIGKERDFVISSLHDAQALEKIDIVKNYMSGFNGRNAGGDFMQTDGAMPFVYLK